MSFGRRELTAGVDRRRALEILDAAVAASARARELAHLLGVGLRTLQRWRTHYKSDRGGIDGRKGSHHYVVHRLSEGVSDDNLVEGRITS